MSTVTTTLDRTQLKGTKTGQVVSDKRHQTRKVVVAFQKKASKYGKYVRRRSSFHVHDPENSSRFGDTVEIAPCRPISKTKCWRLVRIVTQAPQQVEHVTEVATDAAPAAPAVKAPTPGAGVKKKGKKA
jgi:small subunit ribosomal protein S17